MDMEDMKEGKEEMNGKKCMMCGGMHEGCGCSCCGGWGWHGRRHHHGFHILVKIVILVLVFWAGMQFGELRSFTRGGMMRGDQGAMMGGYGYGGGYAPHGSGTATTTP